MKKRRTVIRHKADETLECPVSTRVSIQDMHYFEEIQEQTRKACVALGIPPSTPTKQSIAAHFIRLGIIAHKKDPKNILRGLSASPEPETER